MTDRKHTHTGHCQLCDHVHAINVVRPIIAKHGYTKRWGFFQGTCPGSDHKPYELSADLLPAQIEVCKNAIRSLRQQQKETDAYATTDPTYARLEISRDLPGARQWGSDRRERIAVWGRYTIESTDADGYERVAFIVGNPPTFKNGETVAIVSSDELNRKSGVRQDYEFQGSKPQAFASQWRKDHIASLDREIKQWSDYKAWLTERQLKWTLQPLTPKAVKVEAAVGVKFKYRDTEWTIVSVSYNQYRGTKQWDVVDSDGRKSYFTAAHVTKLLNQPAAKEAQV